MTRRITRQRDIESLKIAARWPDADKNTIVTLASRLAADDADAEGYRYFCDLSDAQPDAALPLVPGRLLPGTAGRQATAPTQTLTSGALAKLDRAASADLGLPQYLRGLALTALPPDRGRAEQAITDLEFVLAVRDLFPAMLLRGAFAGLARAHAVLGHDEQAADAARRSGLGPAPAGTRADARRLLGQRRGRVPLHLAPDPAPGTRHPDRPGLRLLRPRVHHDRRRRHRHRRRHHPGPGQGRAQRPRPSRPAAASAT